MRLLDACTRHDATGWDDRYCVPMSFLPSIPDDIRGAGAPLSFALLGRVSGGASFCPSHPKGDKIKLARAKHPKRGETPSSNIQPIQSSRPLRALRRSRHCRRIPWLPRVRSNWKSQRWINRHGFPTPRYFTHSQLLWMLRSPWTVDSTSDVQREFAQAAQTCLGSGCMEHLFYASPRAPPPPLTNGL